MTLIALILIDGKFSQKQLVVCPLAEEDRREKLDPGVSRNSHFPFHCHYSRNRLVYFQCGVFSREKGRIGSDFQGGFAHEREEKEECARKLSNRPETLIRKILHATRNYAFEASRNLSDSIDDSFYRWVIKYHQVYLWSSVFTFSMRLTRIISSLKYVLVYEALVIF